MAPRIKKYTVTIRDALRHCTTLEGIEATSPKNATIKAVCEANGFLRYPRDFSVKLPKTDINEQPGLLGADQFWVDLVDDFSGGLSCWLVTVNVAGRFGFGGYRPPRRL